MQFSIENHPAGKTVVIEFDDLTDATTLREPTEINRSRFNDRMDSDAKKRGTEAIEWLGVASLASVKDAIKTGWPAGVLRMENALAKIGGDVVPVSLRRRVERSDQGDEFDIHRAYAGGLDTAWSSRKRKARVSGGAQITIATQIGLTSDMHSSTLFWRGAACMRLADILTASGYQVQVIGYNAGTDAFVGGYRKLFKVELKRADAPLDMAALASAVALSGTYRHFFLANQCSCELEVDYGYGTTDYFYELPGADICIRVGDVTDERTARAFVEQAVDRLNNRLQAAA